MFESMQILIQGLIIFVVTLLISWKQLTVIECLLISVISVIIMTCIYYIQNRSEIVKFKSKPKSVNFDSIVEMVSINGHKTQTKLKSK